MQNSHISFEARYDELRARLSKERKKAKLTQEMLAEKLNELGYGKDQSAISDWENGKRQIPLDAVFALSCIFGCDCGYLLGDYTERIHDSSSICSATGLSEETVNTLCNMNAWGVGKKVTSVIDALIYDFNHATKGDDTSPIVYLISWFLRYNGSGHNSMRINTNGEFRDVGDFSGFTSETLKLNDRIVENAALAEIQQGLRSLKKRLLRKERRTNG